MADIHLTQAEADALIAMEKHRLDEATITLPDMGGAVSVPLISPARRERFYLDISRGRIDLAKGKYQTRSRQVIVLVRLDFGHQRHRYPDGEEIDGPHLHVCREGFGDKWATRVPTDRFSDPADRWLSLQQFLGFCNVTRPPSFTRGLFT